MTYRSVDELMRSLRARDEDAAQECVDRYGDVVRRAAGTFQAGRLGIHLDPEEVCQSVWAAFFVNAAAGRYDLQTDGQVSALLSDISQKKRIDRIRRALGSKRDVRRERAGGGVSGVAGHGATPSRIVSFRETIEFYRIRLPDRLRRAFDMRSAGDSWAEIGAALGVSGEAARKAFDRAMQSIESERDGEE